MSEQARPTDRPWRIDASDDDRIVAEAGDDVPPFLVADFYRASDAALADRAVRFLDEMVARPCEKIDGSVSFAGTWKPDQTCLDVAAVDPCGPCQARSILNE